MASTSELGRSAQIVQIRAEADAIIAAAIPVVDNVARIGTSRGLIPPSCGKLRVRQEAAYSGGASLADKADRIGR